MTLFKESLERTSESSKSFRFIMNARVMRFSVYMSRIVRKTAYFMQKQRRNSALRFCFCYLDSTIPLLP